ncbi:hypothetical protein QVD17_08993 [Tagetes erecta]|uniref:Uncharacterized protein n=1 Tax=Tagetes erecta TaxID=13708 RepID=A0AAD8L551_TARER|nr:hypothetical protein QVD17_08993 [Tagetes erecta]
MSYEIASKVIAIVTGREYNFAKATVRGMKDNLEIGKGRTNNRVYEGDASNMFDQMTNEEVGVDSMLINDAPLLESEESDVDESDEVEYDDNSEHGNNEEPDILLLLNNKKKMCSMKVKMIKKWTVWKETMKIMRWTVALALIKPDSKSK